MNTHLIRKPIAAATAAAWSRREFLRNTFWTAGALGSSSLLAACGSSDSAGSSGVPHTPPPAGVTSRFADIGPLQSPDANGIALPAGFTSRVVAVSLEPPVLGGTYLWHIFPDGGATYRTPDGGWIYTSNSELPGQGALGFGGAGALKFAADGTIEDAYPILTRTRTNCAGGKTPWNTWMSCEETTDGVVYDCDPFQAGEGVAFPRLGLFAHEAVAVDPFAKILYLTEDVGDGRFYRFVPSAADWPSGAAKPALQEGLLQVLRFANGGPDQTLDDAGLAVNGTHAVIWEDVAQPDQPQSEVRAVLGAAAPGSRFRGGEGLWFFSGIVYFSTKSDNRIWAYDHSAQTVEVIYDFASSPTPVLSGVDNLMVSEFGDVLVAEDGGDMNICVILPDRRVIPLLQATDRQAGTEAESEISGPAFSPDGTRLYFSCQRNGRMGLIGPGITYEVTLPFSACPSGTCP